MQENYYTAAQAANTLGLKYHTFMARVRAGRYTYDKLGRIRVFEKKTIDQLKKSPK